MAFCKPKHLWGTDNFSWKDQEMNEKGSKWRPVRCEVVVELIKSPDLVWAVQPAAQEIANCHLPSGQV
jgi:hypothetical protein